MVSGSVNSGCHELSENIWVVMYSEECHVMTLEVKKWSGWVGSGWDL